MRGLPPTLRATSSSPQWPTTTSWRNHRRTRGSRTASYTPSVLHRGLPWHPTAPSLFPTSSRTRSWRSSAQRHPDHSGLRRLPPGGCRRVERQSLRGVHIAGQDRRLPAPLHRIWHHRGEQQGWQYTCGQSVEHQRHHGSTVPLTATVISAPVGAAPSGTVTFSAASGTLGTRSLGAATPDTATYTVPASTLSIGSHALHRQLPAVMGPSPDPCRPRSPSTS